MQTIAVGIVFSFNCLLTKQCHNKTRNPVSVFKKEFVTNVYIRLTFFYVVFLLKLKSFFLGKRNYFEKEK